MTTKPEADVEATVRILLDAARLSVHDDELQLFVKTYAELRANADDLYVPEVNSEEPALIFDASWPA
jgi:hypothetical protein